MRIAYNVTHSSNIWEHTHQSQGLLPNVDTLLQEAQHYQVPRTREVHQSGPHTRTKGNGTATGSPSKCWNSVDHVSWQSLAAERNAPRWDADDEVKQNADDFAWSPQAPIKAWITSWYCYSFIS